MLRGKLLIYILLFFLEGHAICLYVNEGDGRLLTNSLHATLGYTKLKAPSLSHTGNYSNEPSFVFQKDPVTSLFRLFADFVFLQNDHSRIYKEKSFTSVRFLNKKIDQQAFSFFFQTQRIADNRFTHGEKQIAPKRLNPWHTEKNALPQDSIAVTLQYELLTSFLSKYRAIELAGGFPLIPKLSGNIRVGDTSWAIKAIRKYLYLVQDFRGDTLSDVYDETLAFSVRQFQHRHGWNSDGIIGKKTLQEMSVPVAERIRQILVNRERCRTNPSDMKKDYMLVNIPAYTLAIYENDSIVKTMRVVVGKIKNQTALFSGRVNSIVFNPYWYIPPVIFQKEILPEMKKDTGYLQRNHMEWMGDILRQKPGPDNPLGKIKFVFPNSHNIYLHDTPSKELFEKEERAFSHGCIRIEDPQWLCNYLMRADSTWSADQIEKFIRTEKEYFVEVKKSIPVFITYFTAWVDETGNLNFRKDIYKKDAPHRKGSIDSK